jgi:hypothetical protein
MRKIGRTLLFASAILFSVSYVTADDATKANNSSKDSTASSTSKSTESTTSQTDGKAKEAAHPYLGVFVSPIHPGIHNHLGDMLAKNQGLIVEDIEEGSAADKAGLKQHDILTMYEDQKLFAAEQLANLIHSDKVGHEVTFTVLRDGKSQKIPVKLGDDTEARQRYQSAYQNGGQNNKNHGRGSNTAHNGANGSRDSGWESFDSLTLKKLKDNKFQAEVQYLDKDGKQRKHKFEGTRDEIEKDIEAEKDLRPNERAHLLQALGLGNSNNNRQFSPFWFDPRAMWIEDPYDSGL